MPGEAGKGPLPDDCVIRLMAVHRAIPIPVQACVVYAGGDCKSPESNPCAMSYLRVGKLYRNSVTLLIFTIKSANPCQKKVFLRGLVLLDACSFMYAPSACYHTPLLLSGHQMYCKSPAKGLAPPAGRGQAILLRVYRLSLLSLLLASLSVVPASGAAAPLAAHHLEVSAEGQGFTISSRQDAHGPFWEIALRSEADAENIWQGMDQCYQAFCREAAKHTTKYVDVIVACLEALFPEEKQEIPVDVIRYCLLSYLPADELFLQKIRPVRPAGRRQKAVRLFFNGQGIAGAYDMGSMLALLFHLYLEPDCCSPKMYRNPVGPVILADEEVRNKPVGLSPYTYYIVNAPDAPFIDAEKPFHMVNRIYPNYPFFLPEEDTDGIGPIALAVSREVRAKKLPRLGLFYRNCPPPGWQGCFANLPSSVMGRRGKRRIFAFGYVAGIGVGILLRGVVDIMGGVKQVVMPNLMRQKAPSEEVGYISEEHASAESFPARQWSTAARRTLRKLFFKVLLPSVLTPGLAWTGVCELAFHLALPPYPFPVLPAATLLNHTSNTSRPRPDEQGNKLCGQGLLLGAASWLLVDYQYRKLTSSLA